MNASPDFQRILAEAAQRRRRFDELQKKLEEQERLKAQQALEDRRRARKEADDRMRKPYRPPPPRRPDAGSDGRGPPRALCKGSGMAARTPRLQQQMQQGWQGRPQWGGGAWGGPGDERRLEEARQLRAARRDELREYISMRRELMQGQGGKAQPGSQGLASKVATAGAEQPPLQWRVVKQEAQLGFQELMRQAGLPVNVGLVRQNGFVADPQGRGAPYPQQSEQAQQQAQQQAQRAVLARCTDGMLQKPSLWREAGQPGSARKFEGRVPGGADVTPQDAAADQRVLAAVPDGAGRAWGCEEGAPEPLPECLGSTSPTLVAGGAYGALGEGNEAEGGYASRLLRLNSDLLASGEGLEGWRCSRGKEGAGPLPSPAGDSCSGQQLHASGWEDPLTEQEQPWQQQEQPQQQGGQQRWQFQTAPGAPAEAAPAPAHQDSAAELAPHPQGASQSSSSSGFASLLGGSWGLAGHNDDDLPRYGSDSESLHDGRSSVGWSGEGLSHPGVCSPASTATRTSSHTGAKLESLEEQMQALQQLRGEVQHGLEGFGGSALNGGADASGSDATVTAGQCPNAATAVPDSACPTRLASRSSSVTAAVTPDHQQQQQQEMLDAAGREGAGAAGAAAEGTVQQQARSFLQQAYALISRLRGSSTQSQEATHNPQPAQKGQQQPTGSMSVVAPALAADMSRAQQMKPAAAAPPPQLPQSDGGSSGGGGGHGEFLRRVSQELVQAGGHGKLLGALGEAQAGCVDYWRLQHYQESLSPNPGILPGRVPGPDGQGPCTEQWQPQAHAARVVEAPQQEQTVPVVALQQHHQQFGHWQAPPGLPLYGSAAHPPMQQHELPRQASPPAHVAPQHQHPAWPDQQWDGQPPGAHVAAAAVASTGWGAQQAQHVQQPDVQSALDAARAWASWQPRAFPGALPHAWAPPASSGTQLQPLWQLQQQQGQAVGGAVAIAAAVQPPTAAQSFRTGYATLAAMRKQEAGRPMAAPASVEAPRKLEGSYVQAAKLAKERAAREEAERLQLQQQSQALKAAAKERLKERGRQEQQASGAAAACNKVLRKPARLREKRHAAAGAGPVLPGDACMYPRLSQPGPAAAQHSVLSIHAWEPWRAPPQPDPAFPIAAAAAGTGTPCQSGAAAGPALGLQQQTGAVAALSPGQSKPAGGPKEPTRGQQQGQGKVASSQARAAGATGAVAKGGKQSLRAEQLLKLTGEVQMLSEHEGLVRGSLERLNAELAAKGMPSSDLDAPLSVASRANSLMQLRLNKSLVRLDGKLAGVVQQALQARPTPITTPPKPTPPARKFPHPPSSSPSKNRHLRPSAAAAPAAAAAQRTRGAAAQAQQSQTLSQLQPAPAPQLLPLALPLAGAAAARALAGAAPWAQPVGAPHAAIQHALTMRTAHAALTSSPGRAVAVHPEPRMPQQGLAAAGALAASGPLCYQPVGAAPLQQQRVVGMPGSSIPSAAAAMPPVFPGSGAAAAAMPLVFPGSGAAAAVAAAGHSPPPRLRRPARLQPLRPRAPTNPAVAASSPPAAGAGPAVQQGLNLSAQQVQTLVLPPLQKPAQPSIRWVGPPGAPCPPAWAGSAGSRQQPWGMQPPILPPAALQPPPWQQLQQPFYHYQQAPHPQLVPMSGTAAPWGWQPVPNPGAYLPTYPGQTMGEYAWQQYRQ